MIPKTKFQIKVDSVKSGLPEITRKQIDWGYNKLFDKYFHQTAKYLTCFECGHRWDSHNHATNKAICPKCNEKLIRTNKRKIVEESYFGIATIHNGYQVLRYVFLEKSNKIMEEAQLYPEEVVQFWIDTDGEYLIKAIKHNVFFGMSLQWSRGSNMEIRKSLEKYFIHAPLYPKKKYLPEIIRNGFLGATHHLHHAYFFHLILSNPKVETILKSGYFEFISEYTRHKEQIEKYWPSIKICIRNKYAIPDVNLWFDQIHFLESFGMDILNSKYICSTTLHADHQRLIRRAMVIAKKENYLKQIEKIEKENLDYVASKKNFFDLKFSNGTIEVVVLKHVKEFLDEGIELNHCVFENEYYKKDTSLIMSARKGNQRLETIQIELPTSRIIQARGMSNEITEYHNDIIDLINKNKKVIQKACKQNSLINESVPK